MMANVPDRRESINADVGPFTISVGFVDNRPVEMFVTARGKSGTHLDDILYELGVTASKMMQGEHDDR